MGQRPAGSSCTPAPSPFPRTALSVRVIGGRTSLSVLITLAASTFSPPVPCAITFAATVPVSGLRASTMGSAAGLSAVPQPSHWRAASVAGTVSGSSAAVPRSPDIEPDVADPPPRAGADPRRETCGRPA